MTDRVETRRRVQPAVWTRTIVFAGLLAASPFFTNLAAAQDQPPSSQPSAPLRATVQGTVRNSATGEPLPRALVQIEGDAETGALTDGEGHFEIPGVPVGPQVVRLVKPGFHDRPYATEETGLQSDGPAHSVLVAQQMPDLAFTLTPNASIRGRIDLSTGDPADGITVNLFKQVVRFGRPIWIEASNAMANGDGVFRFGGLPEGVYALSTQPVLESEPAVSVIATGSGANVVRNGYPSVFYPDARDFAGASPIRLSAGAQTEANISLTLEPFYPVSVVAGSQASGPGGDRSLPAALSATIMDAAGRPLPYTAQYDDATHSLQTNLPDGNYMVSVRGEFRVSLAANSPAVSGRRGNAAMGMLPFTVAGHAVSGLRVTLVPPPVEMVHLRFLHTSDARTVARTGNAGELVNLTLDPADSAPHAGNENLFSMNSDPESIEFTAQPGSYWVTAFLQRKGLCAGTFSAGGSNLAREPLVLSPGSAPPPMEFVLRDDCGTLALNLPPTLASFEPGEEPFYIVYVVPDFDTVQDIPPMTMHPSSGPTLTVDSLTPGSYHVYTFDSPVHLEYRNAAAMSALSTAGQQVTVSAGSTTNLALEGPGH